MMRLAGFEKCSMVDYPGKIAAVVFTRGCNLNCFYCHNRELIRHETERPELDEENIMAQLRLRRDFLDAVVISGGEPTLQPGLPRFLRRLRSLGLALKLDTNGTRPEVLRQLLEEGLLDFVAMDLKAPLGRYDQICGAPVDTAAIRRSVEIILDSGIASEFRTTVVPQLGEEDLQQLVGEFQFEGGCGLNRVYLQQFRPVEFAEDERGRATPHTPQTLLEWTQRLNQHGENPQAFQTRGVA